MALALILRTCPKLSGSTFSHNVVKYAPIAVTTRTLSLSSQQNQILTLKRGNELKLLPVSSMKNNILTHPQARLMSADHSKMWPIEKALSVGLLVLAPATFAFPNFLLDNLFAVATVIHFHWGLEAVVVDYVRPIIVGNVLPKVALGLLYLISAVTLGGLLYFNLSDIGIGRGVRKFWSIKN